MAAILSELTVSQSFPPPGAFIILFILLFLLSIFLTALCSECSRRSSELQDPEVTNDPAALIRVVKVKEEQVERENPGFDPQTDEGTTVTPWRSHLGSPRNQQGSISEEENAVQFPPWRSHLNQAVDVSSPPNQTVADADSSPSNQEPGADQAGSLATPPVHTPEQVEVEVEEVVVVEEG